MNDVMDVTAIDNDKAQKLNAVGWVSYVLHLIVAIGAIIPGAQAGAALLIIALVIDMLNRARADGTWQASHFSWRIRSVIFAGLLYLLTAPLFLLLYVPGAIAWALISLWFLYRIVKGMVAMNQSRTVE